MSIDDDMPELRQTLVQMNKRAKLEHFILKLDDLITEFEQVMAAQMADEYYTSDELSELLADDPQPSASDDMIMVDRALLDDLDQALFAYAPHQTKQLRVRLLNAIQDGSAASVVEYDDMTDEQKRIIDAGNTIAGTFPQGLSREELIKWMDERFSATSGLNDKA